MRFSISSRESSKWADLCKFSLALTLMLVEPAS